jgi:uncharacterized protein
VNRVDDGLLATNASAGAQDSKGLVAAVQGSTRIRSLDVLRGVGVLGMLVVHIQLFAFPSLARWKPTVYGDLQGLNWWVWLAMSVLADGKFISIFAMLLGVSIVMQSGRAGDEAISAWRAHVRRMAALLLLGLLHAYFIWYGDMLVPLALSGSVVFIARRLSPPWLLVLGGLALATASVLSVGLTWTTAQSDPAALAAWRAQWTPPPAVIALEIAQYRGGWAEQMGHRVPAALDMETVQFLLRLLWQMTGLMLIGMALFRLGVLSAARSRVFYLVLGAFGFGGGILLISLGLWRSFATGWDLLDYVLVSHELRYWGNFLVALGWTALVMLLCQRGWPLRPVAAVGRMALSNYLLQSVICTTIFYGHGFGLFGRVDRAGQFAFVLGIWAFQLLASSAWLGYFAVGPVEWVIRWFVYRRRPGFLRSPLVGAGV